MGSVLSGRKISYLIKLLKDENKKIVLAGGCFDVLHPGHVIFLQKAKEAGDVLIVLLESYEKLKKIKGPDRPVHMQKDRAKILSALEVVDYVVMLPYMPTEQSYNKLVKKIKPNIIALTRGYEDSYHKRVAKITGARLRYVTKMVGDHSTSRILNRR